MKIKVRASERVNRRYLLVFGASEDEIKKTILDYVGILGWARAAPEFIKSEKGIILAVKREEINNIRAAFEISPLKIKITKVSGTLKGLAK
ncbi:MAG: hypothetical protein QXD13_00740 [Candidatus Pacearchaeota archaeon]